MRQETRQLDYRAETTHHRRDRLRFGLGLLLVGVILVALRKLETLPYRPPHDMSTFLGGPELGVVRLLMVLFAVVWIGLLVGFAVSWRAQRNAA
jgi:hypothetical protein